MKTIGNDTVLAEIDFKRIETSFTEDSTDIHYFESTNGYLPIGIIKNGITLDFQGSGLYTDLTATEFSYTRQAGVPTNRIYFRSSTIGTDEIYIIYRMFISTAPHTGDAKRGEIDLDKQDYTPILKETPTIVTTDLTLEDVQIRATGTVGIINNGEFFKELYTDYIFENSRLVLKTHKINALGNEVFDEYLFKTVDVNYSADIVTFRYERLFEELDKEYNPGEYTNIPGIVKRTIYGPNEGVVCPFDPKDLEDNYYGAGIDKLNGILTGFTGNNVITGSSNTQFLYQIRPGDILRIQTNLGEEEVEVKHVLSNDKIVIEGFLVGSFVAFGNAITIVRENDDEDGAVYSAIPDHRNYRICGHELKTFTGNNIDVGSYPLFDYTTYDELGYYKINIVVSNYQELKDNNIKYLKSSTNDELFEILEFDETTSPYTLKVRNMTAIENAPDNYEDLVSIPISELRVNDSVVPPDNWEFTNGSEPLVVLSNDFESKVNKPIYSEKNNYQLLPGSNIIRKGTAAVGYFKLNGSASDTMHSDDIHRNRIKLALPDGDTYKYIVFLTDQSAAADARASLVSFYNSNYDEDSDFPIYLDYNTDYTYEDIVIEIKDVINNKLGDIFYTSLDDLYTDETAFHVYSLEPVMSDIDIATEITFSAEEYDEVDGAYFEAPKSYQANVNVPVINGSNVIDFHPESVALYEKIRDDGIKYFWTEQNVSQNTDVFEIIGFTDANSHIQCKNLTNPTTNMAESDIMHTSENTWVDFITGNRDNYTGTRFPSFDATTFTGPNNWTYKGLTNRKSFTEYLNVGDLVQFDDNDTTDENWYEVLEVQDNYFFIGKDPQPAQFSGTYREIENNTFRYQNVSNVQLTTEAKVSVNLTNGKEKYWKDELSFPEEYEDEILYPQEIIKDLVRTAGLDKDLVAGWDNHTSFGDFDKKTSLVIPTLYNETNSTFKTYVKKVAEANNMMLSTIAGPNGFSFIALKDTYSLTFSAPDIDDSMVYSSSYTKDNSKIIKKVLYTYGYNERKDESEAEKEASNSYAEDILGSKKEDSIEVLTFNEADADSIATIYKNLKNKHKITMTIKGNGRLKGLGGIVALDLKDLPKAKHSSGYIVGIITMVKESGDDVELVITDFGILNS